YFGIAASAFASGSGSYALLQSNTDGRTYLNGATGMDIRFRIGNADTMIMDSGNLKFVSAKNVGTDNYVSQTTGWRVDYAGGGDFRYL
ncbi:hypothetical protein ACI3QN_12815, partial [Propionibacterium freudenreichii]|uniref:hypothetical protein n=1 Tax=Propionibacterium freudenreichii TaxID=1744 RepID=UPI0038531A74